MIIPTVSAAQGSRRISKLASKLTSRSTIQERSTKPDTCLKTRRLSPRKQQAAISTSLTIISTLKSQLTMRSNQTWSLKVMIKRATGLRGTPSKRGFSSLAQTTRRHAFGTSINCQITKWTSSLCIALMPPITLSSRTSLGTISTKTFSQPLVTTRSSKSGIWEILKEPLVQLRPMFKRLWALTALHSTSFWSVQGLLTPL